MFVRRTPARTVTVEGIGIHTGASSRVTLSPAPFGAGILFYTTDGDTIPARAENVVDTSRCTVLGKDGVTISTVEHLLSAFAGLGITDASVTVAGPELPIGDGGAKLWVDALNFSSWEEEESRSDIPQLQTPILVSGKNGSFIAAYPAAKLSMTVAAVFEHPLVGTQIARYDATTDDYGDSIAPARTFGFIEEVEALRKMGLALGGSEENAVVVYQDRYSRPLHFDNELARHKLLDVLGDCALADLPLPTMELFAVKPSHRLNVEFARQLTAQLHNGGA